MHKCRPSEKRLILELGLNKTVTTLCSGKETLFLALPGFPGKLHLCNNCRANCRMCTNVRPPEKVLTVNLGQCKLETMSEWYQGFIPAKKPIFQLFLVFLKNCVCVMTADQITGCAQM